MTKMEKLIVLSEVMLLGMSVFRSVKEVSIQSCALYCLNSNVLYFENLLKELFMKKYIYIYQLANMEHKMPIVHICIFWLGCSSGFIVQKESLMYLWLTVN